MNWSDVGNSISKYAPIIGGALSSPVGAVMGLGSLISSIFGVKATPEDVMDYIKNDPKEAMERIKYEMANNIAFQNLALEIDRENNRSKEKGTELENEKTKIINQDTADARANTANIATNPVYNFIMVLLIIGAFSIVGYCMHLISLGSVSQNESPLLSMIIGAFSTCIIGAFGFFFGSSLGSQLKDNIMRFSSK